MRRIAIGLLGGVMLAGCEDRSKVAEHEVMSAAPSDGETALARATVETPSNLRLKQTNVAAAQLVAEQAPVAAQFGHSKEAAEIPLAFRELAQGIDMFVGDVAVGEARLNLAVVRVAMPAPGVELATAQDTNIGGRSLSGYRKRLGAQVALSGGFLASFFPPIPAGYVQVRGEQINRAAVDPVLNGIVMADRGWLSILPFDGVHPPRKGGDALQAGPLLAIDGRSALRENARGALSTVIKGRYNRAFVAIDRSGRALLGWTSEVSLPDLVEVLLRPGRAQGLHCASALNLSGDTNAGLVVAAGHGSSKMGDTESLLPNALVVGVVQDRHQSASQQ